MSVRIHDLGSSAIDDLPDPCRKCVFWEVGARRPPTDEPGRPAKEAWWQATQLEWGAPGKGAYVDGRLVAYALFAPASHLTGAPAPLPVSEDALLLATVWVAEEARSTGVAKALLQAVLRESVQRGGQALEAFGSRETDPGATCLLPESFLVRMGFRVHREHPVAPLLRLDVRQTARWQESVSTALESVVAVLGRRERAPVRPAPGQ